VCPDRRWRVLASALAQGVDPCRPT
jgi:hypothetical protein